MTLYELWSKSRVPMFDMDAPGFNDLARIENYENDLRKIPGYITGDMLYEYRDADVDEISWHNHGIAVKFYKGDEDDS